MSSALRVALVESVPRRGDVLHAAVLDGDNAIYVQRPGVNGLIHMDIPDKVRAKVLEAADRLQHKYTARHYRIGKRAPGACERNLRLHLQNDKGERCTVVVFGEPIEGLEQVLENEKDGNLPEEIGAIHANLMYFVTGLGLKGPQAEQPAFLSCAALEETFQTSTAEGVTTGGR